MPRALTEQEKCRLCQRLLDKGKDAIMAVGIKKVSVDDIARAAGMSKGSFYLHFESKERYLQELIIDMHRQMFVKAQQIIPTGDDFKAGAKDFLMRVLHMPEIVFFMQNEAEISEFLINLPDTDFQTFKLMEQTMFENLLIMVGVDTEIVKPGVVHNYLHTLLLVMGSDLMSSDDLPETFERLTDDFMSYVFGGAS